MIEQKKSEQRVQSADGYHMRKVVENTGSLRADLVRRSKLLISLATMVLIGLIGFRVILKAIGANPSSDFAQMIYDVTWPFLQPFADLVNNPSGESGYVHEFTSVIAMVAYLALCLVTIYLIEIIFGTSNRGTRTVVERDVQKVD